MAAALREVPLDTWKDYLRARVADDYAPLMGGKFEQAAFDFRERTLAGVQQMRPRWERGVQQVEFVMGEPLGRLYVAKHFPPDAKAHMDALVQNLLATFGCVDRRARMDGSRDAPRRARQAREDHRKDRLPGQVAADCPT